MPPLKLSAPDRALLKAVGATIADQVALHPAPATTMPLPPLLAGQQRHTAVHTALYELAELSQHIGMFPAANGCAHRLMLGGQVFAVMAVHDVEGHAHLHGRERWRTRPRRWLEGRNGLNGATGQLDFIFDEPELGSEAYPIPIVYHPHHLGVWVGVPDEVTERGEGFGFSQAINVLELVDLVQVEANGQVNTGNLVDEAVPALEIPELKP